MKVLYISNSSGWSGSSIALKNLLTYLIPKGIEAMVVSKDEGELINWLQEKNISYRIIPFPWNYKPSKKTLWDKITYYWRIFKYYKSENSSKNALMHLCKEFHPDIIHSNNGIIHIGFEAAKKLKIPHVWHIREYQTLDFNMSPIPSMKSFKKKVAQSNNICITKNIQKYFSLNDSNSKVIYDGVCASGTIRYTSMKGSYFLFVGRIEHSKGIDFLIDSFYKFSIKNHKIDLWIAGTGKEEYIKKIKNLINRYGIANRIKFLGFRNDCYDLMYKSKAVIVPSLFEGFGFITVEAIMNGAIVCGRNTAGTAEIASYCKHAIKLFNTRDELTSLLLGLGNNSCELHSNLYIKDQKKQTVSFLLNILEKKFINIIWKF